MLIDVENVLVFRKRPVIKSDKGYSPI